MRLLLSAKLVALQIAEKLRHPNRTPRKMLNFFLYLLDQKILQPERAHNMPTEAFIDVCPLCNLRCPLCPTGLRLDTTKKGKIRLPEFKRILDQISPCLFDLNLYNWGEPFLNKELFDMVAYARSKNIRTLVSSNLNRLPDGGEREVVDSGLDVLMVSLDGASQETYEKYRVGGVFDRVIENIRRVVAEKNGAGYSAPSSSGDSS